MTGEEMAPCPFCGTKEQACLRPVRRTAWRQYACAAFCWQCSAQGPRAIEPTAERARLEALHLWNMRRTRPELAAEVLS